MTPPKTLIDALARLRTLRSPWRRRGVLAALTLVCALLAYFPERYRAVVTFAPSDPSSLGLSGALGQLGAINGVFGNQTAMEIALRIAHSTYTRETVMRRLNLVRQLGLRDENAASQWLDRKVETRTMRGGIVQTEYLGRDQAFGKRLVSAYAQAIQERLAEIARRQTAYKRKILLQLVDEADERLEVAQTNYNQFRLQTRYSDPSFAIESIGGRIPVLQAAIKSKQVELNAARQFATEDNMSVRQIVAQIDALKEQLAQFQALNPTQENSIGKVVRQSTAADKLERKLFLAQSLYDSYIKYLQGTSVEDLTSMASIRILEPPFVDTERQINNVPFGLAILFILLALAIEFYEWRPPVGDRLVVRK